VQKIRVPAGVRDGARLRVRGRGTPGARGGPAGDLEVAVNVAKHPVFGRDGDALTVTVPVTFPEAALGAQVTVPTLDGPVTVKVPAGTTSGRRLRVKGRGFPGRGGNRGPLLVTVEVAVPQKLSAKAKDALATLATELDGDPRAHLAELLETS
jgi:molecular chaperone DnaJ